MSANELVKEVKQEIEEKKWQCPFCEATKRANVFTASDLQDNPKVKLVTDSTLIVIKCRSCGNEDIRYYA